jgi:ribosomal protein S18 acetylase RimI-like enzyme
MINICEASTKDIGIIQKIAYQTWPVVYNEIITPFQIKYMLDLFYSETTLVENMTKNGHDFILLLDNNVAIGFAAFEDNYLEQNVTRLHKLYLLPSFHGKGHGKLLVDAVIKKATENASSLISLNVNKFNPAIDFYRKIGFTIIGEEKLPIGLDFFMDDYKMEFQLR